MKDSKRIKVSAGDDEHFPYSSHSRVKRGKSRASYKKQPVYQLIDDLKLGHIGFIYDERPVVIPITLWRVDDFLYFHVANKSRLHKLIDAGQEVAVSFAESSEWVMAKSAYNHSANYRSAVLYCTGSEVTDEKDFDQIFKVLTDQIEEGRWEQLRLPNEKERRSTALIRLQINEASFKSRTGGPEDEEADKALAVWSGTKAICPVHHK